MPKKSISVDAVHPWTYIFKKPQPLRYTNDQNKPLHAVVREQTFDLILFVIIEINIRLKRPK
jgi:hypothetical protein